MLRRISNAHHKKVSSSTQPRQPEEEGMLLLLIQGHLELPPGWAGGDHGELSPL